MNASDLPDNSVIEIAGANIRSAREGTKGKLNTISLEVWKCIIGFHLKVAASLAAECVTFHKWNAKENRYHTIIPYQNSVSHPYRLYYALHPLDRSNARSEQISRHGHTNLTAYDVYSYGYYEATESDLPEEEPHHVEVLWSDPRNIALLDEYKLTFGEDFLPACSVHSRINESAISRFAGSVDVNECSGWHINLGKLLSKELEIYFETKIFEAPQVNGMLGYSPRSSMTISDLFDDAISETEIRSIRKNQLWHPFVERLNANPEGALASLLPAIAPYPDYPSESISDDCVGLADYEYTHTSLNIILNDFATSNYLDPLFPIMAQRAPLSKYQSVRIAVELVEPVMKSISTDLALVDLGRNQLAIAWLNAATSWLEEPSGPNPQTSSNAWSAARFASSRTIAYSYIESYINALIAVRGARMAAIMAAGTSSFELINAALISAKKARDALSRADRFDYELDKELRQAFVHGEPWATCEDLWNICLSSSHTDDSRISASAVAFSALSQPLYSICSIISAHFEQRIKEFAASHAFAASAWCAACSATWATDADAAHAAQVALSHALSAELNSCWLEAIDPDSAYFNLTNPDLWITSRFEDLYLKYCNCIRNIISIPFSLALFE